MLAALRGSPSIWVARLTVVLIVIASILLGLWGNGHGLPYSFNTDENSHFLPKAIALFGHDWNPNYFVNPPAYTYLLRLVFGIEFDGGAGVARQFASDPTAVFLAARTTTAALLGLAVGLLYLAGARLFDDRRIGVLAAGILGFSFLPIFYAHHALNDVPTLAPVCLALFGVAGIVRYGRMQDLIIAAIGVGIACGTKYTAGIMVLPLAAAALVCAPQAGALTRRQIVAFGLPVAAITCALAFLLVNPYSVIDSSTFFEGLQHQSTTADDVRGKLGLTADSGIAYYLWSMSWGLGWVPLLAAAAGGGILIAERPRIAAVLLPAPLLFLIFMGTQERFFGRWMLPIYPLLALIGAYAVVSVLGLLWRRAPRLEPLLLILAAAALWTQGIASSVHLGRVMSRTDTRNVARAWMVKHIEEGSKIVVEPIAPDAWAQDIAAPSALTSNGNRWLKFSTSRSNIGDDGTWIPTGRVVNIEDYERTLYPGLIQRYQRQGYCWVVVGSTQVGRAEAEPDAVPRALAYYRALEANGELVYRISPFRSGAKAVPFNFDWSFDYYPRDYERPGPEIWIYRLRGGLCSGEPRQSLSAQPAS